MLPDDPSFWVVPPLVKEKSSKSQQIFATRCPGHMSISKRLPTAIAVLSPVSSCHQRLLSEGTAVEVYEKELNSNQNKNTPSCMFTYIWHEKIYHWALHIYNVWERVTDSISGDNNSSHDPIKGDVNNPVLPWKEVKKGLNSATASRAEGNH